MKKITALILSMSVLFLLFGCAGAKEGTSTLTQTELSSGEDAFSSVSPGEVSEEPSRETESTATSAEEKPGETPKPSASPATGSAAVNSSAGVANQKYLYGVCYVDYLMQQRVSVSEASALIGALGVKSVRAWNVCEIFMTDYRTVDKSKTTRLHSLYAALKSAGVEQIIGVSHSWFLPSNPSKPTVTVPYRNTAAGSDYQKFLSMYEEMWYCIVKEFPEVNYWEIGNEMNHDPFLSPVGGGTFTLSEKADITTDMCYYASLGVHRANPNAKTILPGMAPVDGIDGPAILSYFEKIYQNIKSGGYGNGSKNTNDYFQALAWHPYSPFSCPDQNWVDANKRVYEIAVRYGDSGKKVFFTEMGFPDGDQANTDRTQAGWIAATYQLIRRQLPFVESCHYYRLFNDGTESYGLMNEPADGFSAKAKGSAYQTAAGGSGDLNRFVAGAGSYQPGDNIAYRMPVIASTSCEHSGWGWSKGGINDGNLTTQGWSNYYEYGSAPFATDPNGNGASSPDTTEYVGVIFPKSFRIDRVILYSRTTVNTNPASQKIQGLPRTMRVEISNDGVNWSTAANYELAEDSVPKYASGVTVAEQMKLTIRFTPVSAKYVRVVFTKLDPYWSGKQGNYFVQLMEMQILIAE